LCTEWKSTGKGNGLFVRRNGIKEPRVLEGRTIATHQGRHAIHQYLLKHAYGVDPARLSWIASPQETLLGLLRDGKADAVVLLDPLRSSFAYSERNMEEVADVFIKSYGGDRDILITSARYFFIESTSTE